MTALATRAARRRRGRRGPPSLAALLVSLAPLAGCGDDPTGVIPACVHTPQLVPGEVVDGRLTDDDLRRARTPIDYFGLLTTDSATVSIRMTSEELDPFLYLLTAGGAPVAQAFDSTGVLELETVTLTHAVGAGCYLVGASAWSRLSRGAYTITATIADPDA